VNNLEKDLASFIDEAIETPENRDGIVQDLLEYVFSEMRDIEDETFIQGAQAALYGKRLRGQGGSNGE
jgi:hypothetical protein